MSNANCKSGQRTEAPTPVTPAYRGTSGPSPSARPYYGWRKWAARLLLLGGTCTIGLLGMELGVRKFLPFFHPRNQSLSFRTSDGLPRGFPSRTALFGLPGGDFLVTVNLNRWGFRDPKDFTQSSTNSVFVVGDSYAFGWGVEQSNTFSAKLEGEFGTPVFNLAVPGANLLDYMRLLEFAERNGACVHHVVVAVCMENDLWDYTKVAPPRIGVSDDSSHTVRQPASSWIRTHSALYLCVAGTLKRWDFSRRLLERVGLALPVDSWDRPNRYDPQVLAASCDQLKAIARRYNSIFLLIPSRRLWYGSNVAVEQRVHSEFVRMLQAEDLMVADMRPKLEVLHDPLRFFFKHDPHLNTAGHAVAEATLSEALRVGENWKFLTNRPAKLSSQVAPHGS